MLRRTVAFGVLSVLLLSCKKRAALPPDGVYAQGAPGGATLTAVRGDSKSDVPLGPRLSPLHARLFSETNANDRYQLFVKYARDAGCSAGLLVASGAIVASEGYGNDSESCDFSFVLTASQASAAAGALRIPRLDRTPIGDRVRARFASESTSYAVGKPVIVLLTLENPSDAAGVALGLTNCQFSFRVRRDGRPVKDSSAGGESCGGMGARRTIATGGELELRAPIASAAEVASYGDVSVPGHYVVECRYEGDFSPEHREVGGDDDRVWTRSFEGTVEFDVR